MSKMIQVRDVPEQAHGTLKARVELEHAAERPTMQEWLERTLQGKPIRGKRSPAQVVRELRDAR